MEQSSSQEESHLNFGYSAEVSIDSLFHPIVPSFNDEEEEDTEAPWVGGPVDPFGASEPIVEQDIFFRSSLECGMTSSIDIFAIAGASSDESSRSLDEAVFSPLSYDERTDEMDDYSSSRSLSSSSADSDTNAADFAYGDVASPDSPDAGAFPRRSEREAKRKRSSLSTDEQTFTDRETRRPKKLRKAAVETLRSDARRNSTGPAETISEGTQFVWEDSCRQEGFGASAPSLAVQYHTFVYEFNQNAARNR
jgi:hypothetical protein